MIMIIIISMMIIIIIIIIILMMMMMMITTTTTTTTIIIKIFRDFSMCQVLVLAIEGFLRALRFPPLLHRVVVSVNE